MKNIKNFLFLSAFFLSLFAFGMHSCCYAQEVVVRLQINNPQMTVNGEIKEVDEKRGTSPVIKNSRTLVPIRAIMEEFGAKVGWDETSKCVSITLKNDTVKLYINKTIAYFNNEKKTLDTPPEIINERTMLPIRFVSESFNLGVGWNGDTNEIFVLRDEISQEEYDYLIKSVPKYSGKPYVYINNNRPLFKQWEIIDASIEYYQSLDNFGRCGVAIASVGLDLMPTEERKSISSVKPTGWINVSYDFIPGKYLYNRCHLIGFQLTGENANKRNLITGTRYLNIDGMLDFENMVDDYVDETSERVMYRVTPFFKDENLLADGVLMEAYSVCDNGKGLSFCVFSYNVQPGVLIDYKTGKSSLAQE